MGADTIVLDLVDLPVLEAFGPDTRRWLNGMITANVRDLAVGEGTRSALTDTKGRLEGLLAVFCVADDRILIVGEGIDGSALFDRLDRYIIMDEVELEERSHRVLSVQGAGAAAALAQLDVPPIAQMPRDRSGLGGFDLVIDGGRAEAVLGALPGAESTDELESLRVAGGHPRWPQDMDQRTFVHELGLVDEVCSFNKGCYIGQEVINRMNVMGRVNRKLRRVSLGAPITGDVFVGEAKAGRVSSAVDTPDGVRGLGLLRKEAWTAGVAIRVVGPQGETTGTVI